MTDWSFRFLAAPAVNSVDLGDGLDFGYVQGVYGPEEQQGAMARWSDGHATLRLDGANRPAALTLRAAAPRPDSAGVPLQICAGGMCEEVTLGPGWRELRVLMRAPGPITLRSPTFIAPDGRELGVLLDWAAVTPMR